MEDYEELHKLLINVKGDPSAALDITLKAILDSLSPTEFASTAPYAAPAPLSEIDT